MVRTLSRRCTGSTALILFVSVWFRVVRRLVGSRFLWFGELWGCWFPTLAICYVAKIRNLGCKPELKSFIVAKPLQSGFGGISGKLDLEEEIPNQGAFYQPVTSTEPCSSNHRSPDPLNPS